MRHVMEKLEPSILDFLRLNGPSTARDVMNGIDKKYRRNVNVEMVTRCLSACRGHGKVEIRDKTSDQTCIWALAGGNDQ